MDQFAAGFAIANVGDSSTQPRTADCNFRSASESQSDA